MRRMLVTLILGGVWSLANTASASPITINSVTTGSCASDHIGSGGCNQDGSPAYGQRAVTFADGISTSTTWLNWIDTGTGALFDFDFTHSRPGTLQSYATSFESLRFTVGPANTTYAISGAYQVLDVGSPGYVSSRVHLLHNNSGGYLMRDDSISSFTFNESLMVGTAGDGDQGNLTQGSLTGTLLAGQTYTFVFDNYIYAYPDSDSGAKASGCVTLSIGGATGAGSCGAPAAVPDSGISTGGLLALTIGVLAYAFHRS